MKKTILILLCGWFAIMATRAAMCGTKRSHPGRRRVGIRLEVQLEIYLGCCRTGKIGHAGYYLSGETLFRSNLISVSNKQVDFFF